MWDAKEGKLGRFRCGLLERAGVLDCCFVLVNNKNKYHKKNEK
jgi:hypothetical protein